MTASSAFDRRRQLAVLALVTFAGAVAVVSRRPDAVTNPQFWAEDGHYWFADAYNGGLKFLVAPHTGYFQTLARLTGLAGQTVGLGAAPMVFNLVALAVELAPAVFIVSARFGEAVPSLAVRCLLAAVYLALPNFEVHGNLTNAHWHLAILACMVVLATPPVTRPWRVFDIAVLVLSALSGPFVAALVPVALLRWRQTRTRWHAAMTVICVGAAVVQGLTALLTSATTGRHLTPLGESLPLLVRIVTDRVVVPTVTGREGDVAFYSQSWPHHTTLAGLVALGGLSVVAYAAWRGRTELRLFLLFCALVLALGLINPQLTETDAQWPLLVTTSAGDRYFFIPMLGFAVALVAAVVGLRWLVPRAAVGLVLAAAFAFGVSRGWQYPAYGDLHPDTYARQLAAAPVGTTVTVPINPGWEMVLVKH